VLAADIHHYILCHHKPHPSSLQRRRDVVAGIVALEG
jgi:hypothetical protein